MRQSMAHVTRAPDQGRQASVMQVPQHAGGGGAHEQEAAARNMASLVAAQVAAGS
eukprot:SAG22_NODE_532_length_9401_cov_29.999892_2_plen_55_part_00